MSRFTRWFWKNVAREHYTEQGESIIKLEDGTEVTVTYRIHS